MPLTRGEHEPASKRSGGSRGEPCAQATAPCARHLVGRRRRSGCHLGGFCGMDCAQGARGAGFWRRSGRPAYARPCAGRPVERVPEGPPLLALRMGRLLQAAAAAGRVALLHAQLLRVQAVPAPARSIADGRARPGGQGLGGRGDGHGRGAVGRGQQPARRGQRPQPGPAHLWLRAGRQPRADHPLRGAAACPDVSASGHVPHGASLVAPPRIQPPPCRHYRRGAHGPDRRPDARSQQLDGPACGLLHQP